jgi:hypothetical protein
MELVAVSVLDDGSLQLVYRRPREFAADEVIRPEQFEYHYPYEGLREVLTALGRPTPAVGDPDAVLGAQDELDPEMDGLVPDLTFLDGDPGDNILPEDMVATGDPVVGEGLDADVEDLDLRVNLPSLDGRVYTAYFTRLARNARNPYGSRDGASFAGVRTEYIRSAPGPDAVAKLPSGAWIHEGQSAYEDATITSIGFFWVVAVLPRLARNSWKNIRTRGGRVVRVQMKEPPRVIVRWLDGDFQPGFLDPETGERRERYSVLPAWALVDIATGEPFTYDEAQALKAPLRLNAAFRRRVLGSLDTTAWYWQGGPISARQAGVLYWKVSFGDDAVAVVDLLTTDRRHLKVKVFRDDSARLAVSSTLPSLLARFVLQVASWKAAEARVLAAS